MNELNDLDDKKAYVLGYFEQKGTLDHQNFKKASLALKESCNFVAG